MLEIEPRKAIGYIRTSTIHQGPGIITQKYLIEEMCNKLQCYDVKFYIDKAVSGWSDLSKRKSLNLALNSLNENDLFIVKNDSRISRCRGTYDKIIKIINDRGALLIKIESDDYSELFNIFKKHLLENGFTLDGKA